MALGFGLLFYRHNYPVGCLEGLFALAGNHVGFWEQGFSTFQPEPEVQSVGVGIVAAINLALRALATSQPVSFK